jgi:hypothetical protein
MEIMSKNIRIVSIDEITPNPRNNNIHPDAQLARLEAIMRHQGFRTPLVVSNQSGLLIAGHARLEAAKRIGMREVPVSFQDFANDADEYAHMTADNALASWAELDMSGINAAIADFGPELNVELLGIENFKIDVSENISEEDPAALQTQFILVVDCEHETKLQQTFEEMSARGFKCKLIT